MTQMNLSVKQKQGHRTDWWLQRDSDVEEGWIGSLGLADANWHI